MNPIEKHLAEARRLIQERTGLLTQTGKIPAVYRGYVSSFGVDVRQSGVLPTLLLYKATDANTHEKEARPLVVELIGKLLDQPSPQAFVNHAFACNDTPARRNKLRREVMNAAVALKLAMRTFPFDDGRIDAAPTNAELTSPA
ncbi:type III-B CRISPR module-associated protein Cmr5 [Spirosoma sordidisoli]|uniref:CRISPR type III-B/RAMP module-associated protein Cmr5 n=1 Tax=Spirosoma sordidisoli TaxID=2502893 RepID=A0A4Q2UKI5_9BACT|nr:type III-B CRISPR module-associated protein Cmr5 [Spirosoma sordidisoli]RYC70037.1 hypothetical protein EQG79_09205 [Spirosoma sordidisoli]